MAALLRLRSRRLLRAWAGSAAAFLPLPFPLALAGRPSAGTVKSDRCPVCGALLVLVPVRQLSAKADAILTEAAQGALVHYKYLWNRLTASPLEYGSNVGELPGTAS